MKQLLQIIRQHLEAYSNRLSKQVKLHSMAILSNNLIYISCFIDLEMFPVTLPSLIPMPEQPLAMHNSYFESNKANNVWYVNIRDIDFFVLFFYLLLLFVFYNGIFYMIFIIYNSINNYNEVYVVLYIKEFYDLENINNTKNEKDEMQVLGVYLTSNSAWKAVNTRLLNDIKKKCNKIQFNKYYEKVYKQTHCNVDEQIEKYRYKEIKQIAINVFAKGCEPYCWVTCQNVKH